MIHDASDDALKNLATSWGPFQLMGYQVIPLDLNIADIRGDEAVLPAARRRDELLRSRE